MNKNNNWIRLFLIFFVGLLVAYLLSWGLKGWYTEQQLKQGQLEQEQAETAYRDGINLAFLPLFQNIHESTLLSLPESDKYVMSNILKDTREKLLALTVPERFKDLHLQSVIFLSELETAVLTSKKESYPSLFEKMGKLQDEIQSLHSN